VADLGKDLVACISSFHSEPAKINDIMAWFAFDLMGLVTFGEDIGMVRAKDSRPRTRAQRPYG
jgi:hypothetical protein